MPDLHLPFPVEAATGRAARRRGLVGRPQLESDEALWIAPCRSVHTFRMRYPIDVVFLDKGGRVLHIVREMRPKRVTRIVRHATGVLELAPGTLAAAGVRRGDLVDWAY